MKLNYPQKSNGMFILNRDQLDDIAAMTLSEYMPEVLEYPQSVDIEKLTEDGLYLTIQNQMLAVNSPILGMTAFEDVEGVPCLDEMYRPTKINVKGGTVLIHAELLPPVHQKRRRYTIAHEDAHWILHRTYFSPTNQKFQLRTTQQRQPLIACRDTNIERKWHERKTDEDWIEWQADTLAAALLMPLAPFSCFSEQLIQQTGKRCLYENNVTRDYIAVIAAISDRFQVSKTAVEIRLKQLGLIQKEPRYSFAYNF